ncbi:hypothetical protein GCM10022393_41420 [Aquimarina addita]|uniref:Glycosyltransferase 2-like domain-containing protein n=1 Tax=Aquimarina addita TaxID=870485 RepID=A0ABP6UU26_9FLAO
MNKELDISVVIPIYRNNKVLKELHNALMTVLNPYNYEIIYVNDCSPDSSLDTLTDLASQYACVTYLDLEENVGQQKATLQGLKKAIGQKIVVLDGDLQDHPQLIPLLYQAMAQNNGSAAFVKRKGMYQSKGRMTTSVLIKKIIQLLSGLHYKAGSYYMFDNSLLKKVTTTASNCQYPYMSIIVAHFASQIQYISADRGKSIGPSGYTFSKRIKAAVMAIYCSLYCTYTKLIPD